MGITIHDHDTLMDMREHLYKATNKCDIHSTNRLIESVDYLAHIVDVLIYEIEALKKNHKQRKHKESGRGE